jgi:hypothetical protein
MSALLEKSTKNIEAAAKLIEAKLDASSVHCSYYSCVQHMLHIKGEYYNEDSERLLERCKFEQKGSHFVLINEIKDAIRNVSKNASEYQTFSHNIESLKRNRIDADYQNVAIDKSKSGASLAFANKINGILARNFTKK